MQERIPKLGKEQNEDIPRKISFTALLVAYYRTMTDIPYSKEIFEAMVAVCKPEEVAKLESHKLLEMAPIVEARYKLVNRLMAANHTNQVLELASGFSQHGLEFLEKDPNATYVEVDLPDIIQAKAQVLKNLQVAIGAESFKNLHLQTGNVVAEDTFLKAERVLNPKPVTVINEGLLRYLSFEHKAVVAKNIHALLKKFGGVWITPDISIDNASQIRHQEMRAKIDAQRQKVAEQSGANLLKNRFKDVAAAKEFFQNLDFSVEIHNFREILNELVSPSHLGLSPEEVEELIGNAVVFVMKPNI